MLGLLHTGIVPGDTVVLTNGDQFSGKLMPREGNRLFIRTEYAGVLKINWAFVKELSVSRPALLKLNNGNTVRVQSLVAHPNRVVYTDPEGEEFSVESDGIIGIDTEAWLQNEEGVFSGFGNLSLKSDRGNGDAEFADVDFDITYRRHDDRFRMSGELEKDIKIRDSGFEQVTKNEWKISGNYDYFLDQKKYITGSIGVEADAVTDLDYRLLVGPLLGYQFYESRRLNLLGEVGVLYVNERYTGLEDDSFWQPSWHVDFDKYVWENRLQLYHEHFGSIKATDTSSWLFRSWTGLRIPIRGGFIFSFEYSYDYDEDVPEGDDKSESTTRFKLGYKW